MSVEQEYDDLLRQVETRSWKKCDLLSGEQINAVTVKDDTTAVLVFSRKTTNKPHIRTVILARSSCEVRWGVRTENTVVLPAERPSDPQHSCSTTNTREMVKSVTPSLKLNGSQVDAILAQVDEWDEHTGSGDWTESQFASHAAELVEYLRGTLR